MLHYCVLKEKSTVNKTHLVIMAQEKKRSLTEVVNHSLSKLTTNITYIVLFGFIGMLISLLILAWSSFNISEKGINVGQEWLNLFRDGFLILSGILTTLIGYYFGNRGSENALKEVERIKNENEKILNRLEDLAPTTTENSGDIEPIINS